MTSPSISSETLHASCVTLGGRGILIAGASGSGKSDLSLRLIDRGATLVSDDYTIVQRRDGRLHASPPNTIEGRIEIRGIGIIEMDFERDVPLCLAVDLSRESLRMPGGEERYFAAGVALPMLGLNAHEASAPLKVELALLKIGLPVR